MDGVPEGIDGEGINNYLAGLPGVLEIHDLHIWAMSTTENALTAHLIMQGGLCPPTFLAEVGHELDSRFQIHHTTLQIEAAGSSHACRQAPRDIV